MNLGEELGYHVGRPNPVQRAVQAFGATRPGAWFFSKTLAPMDRAVSKVSRGRTTVPAIFAGLPVLLLTSTGRRSGQPRDSHLIAVPFEGSLALIGTNYGQPRTPGWVHNLEANPDAAVTYRGVTREVRARPASDPERDAVLARSRSVYGGYVKYQQRITGRRLRIFILEPRSAEPAS
ncbi:MAG TPA: nitroreductase family deazaflavin-dependent oxidoreductase [Jatrophihabitans sp.]|nr:nitroreductase family deazaflavin-dependent oxidoreductase [Jatrophihabitans sp.]